MMCSSKNQAKILDNGDGADQRKHPDIPIPPKASPVSSRERTVPPPGQPLRPGVVDNGDGVSQRKDLSVSNTPTAKASPVSGCSRAQNIVVLGPTGGGASSVVNLIIGRDVAAVSNGAERRTTEVTAYPIKLGGAEGVIQGTLYDMPDFNSSPPALPSGNINLAIVCMEDRTPQVKEAIGYLDNWANQNSCDVPVLVIINHMTPCPDPNWWGINKGHFAKLRLVAGHACLTRKERLKNTEELRSLIIELLSRRA